MSAIDAVVSDVDGTLTNGQIHCPGDGSPPGRSFHTSDGLGTHLLLDAGISVAWLSATSEGGSIATRARMLRVPIVDAAPGPKQPRFLAICERLKVPPERVAYIGDDVNDLECMELAGLSACPADAHTHVRARADLVLTAPGGRGAFRELADLILAARGRSPA